MVWPVIVFGLLDLLSHNQKILRYGMNYKAKIRNWWGIFFRTDFHGLFLTISQQLYMVGPRT